MGIDWWFNISQPCAVIAMHAVFSKLRIVDEFLILVLDDWSKFLTFPGLKIEANEQFWFCDV